MINSHCLCLGLPKILAVGIAFARIMVVCCILRIDQT
jgi:hypothetical protein